MINRGGFIILCVKHCKVNRGGLVILFLVFGSSVRGVHG
jgi:hypothetical protein